MDVTRQAVLIFTLIFGPLVLLSYVYGVSHSEDPSELWGGIPETWWSFIVPFMFIAAAGFMAYWYVIFFKLDEKTLGELRWPWVESDGLGNTRLLASFALVMIPSALWLESTLFHINSDYSWTPILVIGILTLVSIGNVMMGLLAYAAYKDGVDYAGIMLTGSIMLGIQCILNDWILWTYKFPW
jgi:hypothetical protein|tara:strand:+ start:5151 stop:5702 length:552 start_codon:yes stop_codon:yes gene_type:complete